jgi:large subunit ribosomal protein L22
MRARGRLLLLSPSLRTFSNLTRQCPYGGLLFTQSGEGWGLLNSSLPLRTNLHTSSRLNQEQTTTGTTQSNDFFAQTFAEAKKKLEEKQPKEKIVSSKIVERNIRVSPKRLNPLLKQIRGLSYKEAVVQLTFCTLRFAPDVKAVIEKARKQAELKYDLDPDKLLLHEIYLNKGQYGPERVDWKAKGRFGIMRKKYCHLTVILKEVVPGPDGRVGKFPRGVNAEKKAQQRQLMLEAARALRTSPWNLNRAQIKYWPDYRDKVYLPKLEARRKAREEKLKQQEAAKSQEEQQKQEEVVPKQTQ